MGYEELANLERAKGVLQVMRLEACRSLAHRTCALKCTANLASDCPGFARYCVSIENDVLVVYGLQSELLRA